MSDNYFIHVFNITWDLPVEDAASLPSEVVICDLSEVAYQEVTEHPSDIEHYLASKYGERVIGFSMDNYTGDNPHVKEIINRIGEEYAI